MAILIIAEALFSSIIFISNTIITTLRSSINKYLYLPRSNSSSWNSFCSKHFLESLAKKSLFFIFVSPSQFYLNLLIKWDTKTNHEGSLFENSSWLINPSFTLESYVLYNFGNTKIPVFIFRTHVYSIQDKFPFYINFVLDSFQFDGFLALSINNDGTQNRSRYNLIILLTFFPFIDTKKKIKP